MDDLIGVVFWVGCVICWFNAAIHDIGNNNAIWAVLDFLIAPVGVIRGLVLFFN